MNAKSELMHTMNNTKQSKVNRMLVKFALMMIYLTIVSYGMFFAEEMGRTAEHWHTVNLVPFEEIDRYISNVDTLGIEVVLINILGNVAVFLPFGFLIPSMWPTKDKRHPFGLILLSLVFSATIEVLQYLTQVGSADIDDCILNTLGGFIGYMFYRLWRRLRYGKTVDSDEVVEPDDFEDFVDY